MSWEMVLRLSAEWLLTKPLRERTYAEFVDIVDHFATVYAVKPEVGHSIRALYMRLPDWQKPR